MAYNPAKRVLSEIVGRCYENRISLTALAKKLNYSSGTAHNDRLNPENMSLKRLMSYIAALGIKEITIKLEED